MSSFPGDTRRLVGEGGAQGAGPRDATGMVERLKPRLELTSGAHASPAVVGAHLRTLRSDKVRSGSPTPSLPRPTACAACPTGGAKRFPSKTEETDGYLAE